MNTLPVLAADLIEELSVLYPERTPSLNTQEKEIWYDAGARSVVRALEERLRQAKLEVSE